MVANSPNHPTPPPPRRRTFVGAVDVQADGYLIALQAEKLEQEARVLLDKAARLRRSLQAVIRLELQGDGLVVITGWRGERIDSFYRPMPLSEALTQISSLAEELREPDSPSSPDAGAR